MKSVLDRVAKLEATRVVQDGPTDRGFMGCALCGAAAAQFRAAVADTYPADMSEVERLNAALGSSEVVVEFHRMLLAGCPHVTPSAAEPRTGPEVGAE